MINYMLVLYFQKITKNIFSFWHGHIIYRRDNLFEFC